MNYPCCVRTPHGIPSRSVIGTLCALAWIAVPGEAQNPGGGGSNPDWSICPDDGTMEAGSNVTGQEDKVVTIESTGSDEDFVVEVYDPGDPDDPDDDEVLDSVAYEDGAGPPITVGPGLKARVNDGAEEDDGTDSDTWEVKFKSTMS